MVFGATGRQGGSAARALSQAHWPVLALVRDVRSRQATALREAGVELVPGSFTDTDVIRTALLDAYGVFSVLPGNLAAEEEVCAGVAIAHLAAESGVAHLVYSSGGSAGARPTGVARFDAKPRIEAHVRQLPIAATIVRPMIFMETLVRPGFGLNKGLFTSFVHPDQAMQLIAVEDIGKFVAAIFADRPRFGGQTLKVAGDTVTGRELEAAFTEAAGHPIVYARFPDDVLAANPDLMQMAASLNDGPLADRADLNLMREINPELLSFRSWLAGSGRQAFIEAVEAGDPRDHDRT